MTIAPSTSRPKSIAPSDIRLPVTPMRTMPSSAIPIDSGIASAAISAPRTAPQRQEQHHRDQQRAPSARLMRDRLQHAADELGAVVVRPDLDARRAARAWISASRSFTACTTSREFAPVSIITVPATISPSPCLVTAPKRSAGPIAHLAQVA